MFYKLRHVLIYVKALNSYCFGKSDMEVKECSTCGFT